MTSRALRFGAVAAAYEQYRPAYPDELVDLVIDYGRIPIRTALEIGAGTGKATRAFAARGLAITASEPDPAMLDELRKHVPPSVSTMRSSFEQLPLDTQYDLVFAAASMHWTDPQGRWERVAALLRPGGVFANFGGPLHLADPGLDEAVRAARSRLLADDGVASPDGTPPGNAMQWPGTELIRSQFFDDVRQSVIARRQRMPAEEYLGHLSTLSAYLELPDPVRDKVFDVVRAVLPAQVTVAADLDVHLARRI